MIAIGYGLPVCDVARFAKHLTEAEVEQLADMSLGFSGRDVKKASEAVERSHAASLIRSAISGSGSGSASEAPLTATAPVLGEYVTAVKDRIRGLTMD